MAKVKKITEKDSLAEEFFSAGVGLADSPREDLVIDVRRIITEALEDKKSKKEIERQFKLAVTETLDMSELEIKKNLQMGRRNFRKYASGIFDEAFPEKLSAAA